MLSTRRVQILDALSMGMKDREIAGLYKVSYRTIKQHIHCMFNILDVDQGMYMRLLVVLWWMSLHEIERAGATVVPDWELRAHFKGWVKGRV